MEIECVVCGSQNDLRALRCFVCGAELPPASTLAGHYDSTLNPSSLQGLHVSVKTPLSVGALPLEEMLSKRPYDFQLNEQQISASNVSILLEPEELSPLSKSLIQRETEHSQSIQDLDMNESVSESIDDISLLEDIPDLETQNRLENQAQQRSHSTWIGVPAPDLKKDSSTYAEFEQARLEQRSKSIKNHSNAPEPNLYTPISSLLESHQRSDLSEEQNHKQIVIPRENSLTGDELKNIESEVLPNPWTPISKQAISSTPQELSSEEQNLVVSESTDHHLQISSVPDDSGEPMVIDPPSDANEKAEFEEPETALRISIPELLAIAEPISTVDTPKSFVPITSMAYPHEKHPVSNEEAYEEVYEENHEGTENHADEVQVKDHPPVALPKAESLSINSEELPTRKFDQPVSGFSSELGDGNDGFSLISWVLLVLASVSVGVVIALYLMPHVDVGIETRLQTTQITRGEGKYRVNLKAFAKPQANLIIPDSYLTLGQSPMVQVKGTATFSIEVPDDLVRFGQNHVTLQWAYASGGEQPQRFSPVEVSIPVYHKQGEVSFSTEKQSYILGIQLSSGVILVDSEQDFEPAQEVNYYQFVVPKIKVDSQKTISFTAQIETKDKIRKDLRLSYSLPQNTSPLVILSPVKRYARPDQSLEIQGRATPKAQVSIGSLKKNGSLVNKPDTVARVDDKGFFSLPFKFAQQEQSRDGTVWTIDLVVVDHMGHSQSQSIELKQSHTPTWRRYVKRLESRRDRAQARYRKFSQKRLSQKINEYKGKAGMISGVISFIDRGNKEQIQRFLLHTCAQQKCPVWVEDQNAFWIKLGQKVSIFGVVSGEETFEVASGEALTAPLLRSRLTTP